jgi:hypothetical protein
MPNFRNMHILRNNPASTPQESQKSLPELRSNKAGLALAIGGVVIIWSGIGFAVYEVCKARSDVPSLPLVKHGQSVRPLTMHPV